jgi:hypothetical protein
MTIRPKTHRSRPQRWQHLVEQLWSRAVAAERIPPQTLRPKHCRKKAETVAMVRRRSTVRVRQRAFTKTLQIGYFACPDGKRL